MTRDRLHLSLIAVVIALTLLRLWAAGRIELLPEEAYYWTYSKHLAPGYFDHPPMVAWMIRAGTALLGDTERGVRIVNIFLWIGSCALLWQTASIWFGERVASGAALLFCVLPIFMGTGFIVTPDGPLVFFWTLTLYAVSRALHASRSVYWLLAGAAFGGALLSKYYALLLAPSLLLFLLFSAQYRRWLLCPQPWLALVVALAMFSPVILWNAHHQWVSFAFQSSRTAGAGASVWKQAGMFWLVQLGILTPPLFVLLVIAEAHAVRHGWLRHEDGWNFVSAFSLPLFLLFVIVSLNTGVHLNWTAPAFLSLTLGGAAVWLAGADDRDAHRARPWRMAAWLSAGLCAVVLVAAHVNVLFGKPESLAYSRVGGWRELATQVSTAQAELSRRTGEAAFVLGADKYNTAAELGFYLGNCGETVNMMALGERGLGYRFWTNLQRFEGRPAVVVAFNLSDGKLQELRAYFDEVDEPLATRIGAPARRWQSVYLVNCRGYHAEPRALTEASGGL